MKQIIASIRKPIKNKEDALETIKQTANTIAVLLAISIFPLMLSFIPLVVDPKTIPIEIFLTKEELAITILSLILIWLITRWIYKRNSRLLTWILCLYYLLIVTERVINWILEIHTIISVIILYFGIRSFEATIKLHKRSQEKTVK